MSKAVDLGIVRSTVVLVLIAGDGCRSRVRISAPSAELAIPRMGTRFGKNWGVEGDRHALMSGHTTADRFGGVWLVPSLPRRINSET